MPATTRDLRAILDDIRREYGRLEAPIVLKVARDESHPLHSHFDWNDATAAEAHRLRQAAELIRRCRVRYREGDDREGPRSVRAFHSMPDVMGRAYEPAEEIAADPLRRKILLAEMERDWRAFKRRWSHFAEFVELIRRELGEEAG